MSQSLQHLLILCFISDLYFVVKIQDAASKLGFEMDWIENVDLLSDEPLVDFPEHIGEHTTGIGGKLIDKLSSLQPVLIIFDLNNSKIPWDDWIPLIKSSPATRRIPVMCYGSHVDTGSFNRAKLAGADVIVPRSKFSSQLIELIQATVKPVNLSEVNRACSQPLSVHAIAGIELFNQGDYFNAHEFLEEAWNEEISPGRELYRAILQVAVAYLQIEHKNYSGAIKMFWRVRQWINPLPDLCRGVDIEQLRLDSTQAYTELLRLGPSNIAMFNSEFLHPVKYSVEI